MYKVVGGVSAEVGGAHWVRAVPQLEWGAQRVGSGWEWAEPHLVRAGLSGGGWGRSR